MLLKPEARRVLIYGDSFVYGKESGRNARLPVDVRFTGVTQALLGDEFEVIEEGLRGRMLQGENTFFPDRDGSLQLSSITGSHLPVDLVVIFLGTNDCNSGSTKSAEQIADSLRNYPMVINEWCDFLNCETPKILIVAPPAIDPAHYDEAADKIFGASAPEKVAKLPELYRQVSEELGAAYLDASKVCTPATGDGIHLDKEANHKLADALASKIKEILP